MCLLFVSVFIPTWIAALLGRWAPGVLALPAIGLALLLLVGGAFRGKDGVLLRALALAFYGLFWLPSLTLALGV